ncbi:hypothetical protein ACP70R_009338 [Stipagrostis hirtigluma subsp. patula]
MALTVVRMLRGRWFMVYASFLIMSVAGAPFIFSVYSGDIKAGLGYTQEQLNTVGFFMDVGTNVGIHAGLVAQLTPPWFVLAVSAAMNLGGYLMLYLSVTGQVPSKPPLWLVCLYIVIGANSQAFANTGTLVTCVTSFPDSRGAMLGLLKGFLGLSGAIFSQLHLAFHGAGDTRPLILLVGWLPAAISVAFMGTVRVVVPEPPRTPATARREFRAFCGFLYVSLALAAYLMVAIVLQRQLRFTRAEYGLSTGVVLAMLLLPPLAIVHREEAADAPIDESSEEETRTEAPSSSVATKQTAPPEATAAGGKSANPVARVLRALRLRPPPRGHDHTIVEALVSTDMLLLLTATALGVGGMLTAMSNVGQIGESLGYPHRSIATFASLVSIWNYLGRVCAGFASDAILTRHRLPRPLLLSFVLLLAVAGHLLIAYGVPGSLYTASVIVGFCYGATQPLILATISELFGLKYYSTLSNFGNTVSPVGSYVLNVRVAGRMYDREAARQGGGHAVAALGGKVAACIGVRCYKESFMVISAATAAAAAVAGVLAWRTRVFYARGIDMTFGTGIGEKKEHTGVEENARGVVAKEEAPGGYM